MTASKNIASFVSRGNVSGVLDGMPGGGMSRKLTFMKKLGNGEGMESSYRFLPPAEGEDMMMHTIVLKRAVLCPDADHTDTCVIEVETKTDEDGVERYPLLYLREDTVQVALDILFMDETKLRLIRGKGPVYLIGEYIEEWREPEPESEDSEAEEVEGEGTDNGSDEEVPTADENKENGAVRKRKLEDKDTTSVKKSRTEEPVVSSEPMEEQQDKA